MIQYGAFLAGIALFLVALYFLARQWWREDRRQRHDRVAENLALAEAGQVVRFKSVGPWPEKPTMWNFWRG
jgi:hypothetical protein